jgi:beta-mannanase
MAKKMFGKMNPSERISKAKDAAERVVSRASWNKERERTNHQGNIKSEMLAWVETKGHAMFLEYLKAEAIPSLRHKVTTSMEKVELLDTEMKTIERVQKDFSNNKTALVVKDLGKYLVKIGDNVELYDDNTLPVDMRMKMGMLKLVEDEQYLTDVGCKVSSEIFVLLVDLTNVSEGV